MRTALTVLLSTFSLAASATPAPTLLNVSFGGSVPKDTTALLEKQGPSRANGGERIVVTFKAPKMISDIKLSAYSSKHDGKALVHSANGINGSTKVALEGLYTFAKMTMGDGVEYKKLVMLPDTKYVEAAPNQAFTSLDFTVEGFANDDVSLSLQITSADGLPLTDFLITRTGDSETAGGMINELNYKKFQPADVQALMTESVAPKAAELDGKTYTCTIYSRLNPTQLDFKIRAYSSPSPGVLQSTSTQQGTMAWSITGIGAQTTIPTVSGCGKFNSINILRRTSAGNLISEVVLDLNAFVAQCEKAGYDPDGVRSVESNETFPSVVDSKYVVDSYEFCKPQ
jgi:hypothetical protein